MTNHKTMYFKWQKPFFLPIYSLSHRHITSHCSNYYCSCSQFQSFLAPASVEWSSQVDDPQILRSNVQIYLPTTDFNFKIIRFIAKLIHASYAFLICQVKEFYFNWSPPFRQYECELFKSRIENKWIRFDYGEKMTIK